MILWKNTSQRGDPNYILIFTTTSEDGLDIHRFYNKKLPKKSKMAKNTWPLFTWKICGI